MTQEDLLSAKNTPDNLRKMHVSQASGQYGRMKSALFAVIAAAVVAASGSLAADAATDPLADARAPFDALLLSAELAREGRARADPWALAVAARLRKQVPTSEIARAPDGAAPAPAATPDEVSAWLDQAESLGGDDPRLAALVKEVRETSFKGRAGGPQVSKARVGPGASHHYGESFEIGRPAVVYVEGDGDTDLLLRVVGPGGDTACAENGPGDVKLCAWTALRSGRYAVEVLNRGRVDNAYAFATN
jgi:hypothetical protein